MNEDLMERFGRQRFRNNRPGPSNEAARSDDRVNPAIREYFDLENAPVPEGSKDWLRKSEIPTSEELLDRPNDTVEIYPNRLHKPWSNRKKYLQAHYELLREDTVSSLRDSLDQFKNNPEMCDERQLAIYEKVYICGFTFAGLGIAARVRFSTARTGKNISWEFSKRLMAGSLVVLTPKGDALRTKCIVATVAARPLENVVLSPPMIDIYFARPEEFEFDPQQEFVMIEDRTAYFEASRHTLKALQKLNQESFPLSEHIVKAETNVPAPEYLISQPMVDMSPMIDSDSKNIKAGPIDIISDWPVEPIGRVDESQWAALNQILTSRLAIVQGPPGTGKTYVSVSALQILLKNRRPGDPPVIVTAQTNHALDQILRHISAFDTNFIRLGARSKDQDIKRHTIYETRKDKSKRPPVGCMLFRARKKREALTRDFIQAIEPFVLESQDHPISPAVLAELGIITRAQAKSIVDGASQWTSAAPEMIQDPMSIWLGKHRSKFEVVYQEIEFGCAEGEKDEEYEQLKELEAEAGVDEEINENLNGLYQEVRDNFTCRITNSMKGQAEGLLARHGDMWDISERFRGAVYLFLQARTKTIIREKLRDIARSYAKAAQETVIGRWEADAVFLQQASVVGMTTTGFSKYRGLISSLKPKIVLIEEAAEVIESPVTVACVDSLEHLILVGDHQQLQGSCSVQEMADKFNLHVSMFERLVGLQMPFKMLNKQRRMAPEIRRALYPIYPDLEDHPTVSSLPLIPGMGDVRSYFFTHDWQEDSDGLFSKYNEREADFIVGFFAYLVLGGLLPPKAITVLTFYNGQRKLILRKIRHHDQLKGTYPQVSTVDSYQGEENAVILLSLVRSNDVGKIGFLEVANRVCVAMSRAKSGFYMFGNAQLLYSNPLWNDMLTIMSNDPARVGSALPIKCVKHLRNATIEYPEDWTGIYGCNLPCTETLACGHPCGFTCHIFDHSSITCPKPCRRTLACGHKCGRMCSDGQCACREKCASENKSNGDDKPDDFNPSKPYLTSNGTSGPGPSQGRTDGRAVKENSASWANGPNGRPTANNHASDSQFAERFLHGRLNRNEQPQSRQAYVDVVTKTDQSLANIVNLDTPSQMLTKSDLLLPEDGYTAAKSNKWTRTVVSQKDRKLGNGRVVRHQELAFRPHDEKLIESLSPKPKEVGMLIDLD